MSTTQEQIGNLKVGTMVVLEYVQGRQYRRGVKVRKAFPIKSIQEFGKGAFRFVVNVDGQEWKRFGLATTTVEVLA